MDKVILKKVLPVLVVLVLAALAAAPLVGAVDCTATRTLPTSVQPGAQFDVGIVVAGCGAFAQVRETLPPGFSYVSVSDPANVVVAVENGEVRFTFFPGAISFSYRVEAPVAEDTYDFGGVVLDGDKNQFTVAGDTSVTVGKVLDSIAAVPDAVSLPVGGTQQLTVTATYDDASTDDVTAEADYESSDTSVATVSAAGLITAVGKGSATVTVAYSEGAVTKTAEVSVEVYKVLDSIVATPGAVSLAIAEAEQLAVTATYQDASTADVTAAADYESSDTSVATVSAAGLVKAVGEGTATITVTYTEGAVTRTDNVEVDVVWGPWAYDEDKDGTISKMEAIKAVQDYYNDEITKAQVLMVIALYYD